jgi:hypothetical protein
VGGSLGFTESRIALMSVNGSLLHSGSARRWTVEARGRGGDPQGHWHWSSTVATVSPAIECRSRTVRAVTSLVPLSVACSSAQKEPAGAPVTSVTQVPP